MILGNVTDARLRLIVSGVLGLMLTLTICVLWVTGQEVPELLKGLVTMIWGFFTGHVYTNGTGAAPRYMDRGDYEQDGTERTRRTGGGGER